MGRRAAPAGKRQPLAFPETHAKSYSLADGDGAAANCGMGAAAVIEAEKERERDRERERLARLFGGRFGAWRHLLRNGFSLLLYGLGSKQLLLELFAEACRGGSGGESDGQTSETAAVVALSGHCMPELTPVQMLGRIVAALDRTAAAAAATAAAAARAASQSLKKGRKLEGLEDDLQPPTLHGQAAAAAAAAVAGRRRKAREEEALLQRIRSCVDDSTTATPAVVTPPASASAAAADARATTAAAAPAPAGAGAAALRLFVIVHGMDGLAVRSSACREVLAMLAGMKRVHVVGSVDHACSMALFDKQTATLRFSFWPEHVATHSPFSLEEKASLPGVTVDQSQSATTQSAEVVLRSLTGNAREVFTILAARQLEEQKQRRLAADGDEFGADEEEEEEDGEEGWREGDGGRKRRKSSAGAAGGRGRRGFDGVAFPQLYRSCRAKFAVTSETALRAHLRELTDHGVVRTRKTADGTEGLVVGLPADAISSLLARMRSWG